MTIEQPDPSWWAKMRTKLQRDRWLATLDGGLPQVPTRDALPVASAQVAYLLVTIRGTPDVTYQCLRDAGGVWDWRTVATG